MSLYFKIKNQLYQYKKPNGYIPQFRLEGRARDPNNDTALEMRTADPLWMLGRQWQFGEFNGEDNGSPIDVRINSKKEKLSYYSFNGDGIVQELGSVPLEAKVEAKAIEPKDLKSKVRVGQKMEELIEGKFPEKAAKYIADLREEYPLQPEVKVEDLDQKSKRFFELMKGNVIDGKQLRLAIQEGRFPYQGFMKLKKITIQLQNWYETLFFSNENENSWNSKKLVHHFGVHGKTGTELNAPDYQSGHLDWYSFDSSEVLHVNTLQNTETSESFMPVNVSFAAMPDKRLFSFEDSKLDLSGMNLEDADLLRMMILDFSLVSGSDWYTVPLPMKLGEICWINRIEVKDVFGVTTYIENDYTQDSFANRNTLKIWDGFKIRPLDDIRMNSEIQSDEKQKHFLYLPPVTSFRQESIPLEELLFLRDEYANMVWAIEKTVTNEMGKPTNGFDLHLELNGPFSTEKELEENQEEDPLPQFRLASTVPTNWIPYLPHHIENSSSEIELRRAVMMRNENYEFAKDIEPISKLAKDDLLVIREEVIPRAGIRIQLTKQRIRWTDGKTYIWLGRKVLAGKGEGSSGLIFDQLK